MSNKGFEFLDHPADIWVHSWGPKLEDAFEGCVIALMKTMTDISKIEPKIKHKISMSNDEIGALLVDFLSEFLYLFDTEGLIFNSIIIEPIFKDNNGIWHINAEAIGEPFDLSKHFQDTEVKAITYSYLKIKQTSDRVDIEIVYDI